MSESIDSTLHHELTNHLSQLKHLSFPQWTDGLGTAQTGDPDEAPDQSGLSHASLGLEESENYLKLGFLEDLPGTQSEPQLALEEPDYSRFQDWIPDLICPDQPCDYCGSRNLKCLIRASDTTCTPCKTLFRECSFVSAGDYDTDHHHIIDTLHVVNEDSCTEQGSLTGIRHLKSKSLFVRSDDVGGCNKRNGIRFSKHAVKTLRDWLDAHAANPYPTEQEKRDLERRTELKASQIANWLANARRRRKVSETRKPALMSSPSLQPTASAIAIPRAEKPWDELNPLERWKHSPPENEPALIQDIAYAVATTNFPDGTSQQSSSYDKRQKSSNESAVSKSKAASTTSFDTGKTTSLSASTLVSSRSHGSFGSFSSSLAGKKERRRRSRPSTSKLQRSPDGDKARIFQCTFCTDTFKSKYDWTRHEKSLHLSLEKWICAPHGGIVKDSKTGKTKCAYCEADDPTNDHLETHNHRQCDDKGLEARTFFRKDHLRQHMRLIHECTLAASMDSWRVMATNINSRCGFCGKRFTIWQERVDHLTTHFKNGAHMRDWKGCRGLDPAVAAQVTNAMPPYLIGDEALTPMPFSATNTWTCRCMFLGNSSDVYACATCDEAPHHPNDQYVGAATCWERLTVSLGNFATEKARQGQIVTDEDLQAQARRIVFGTDDNWNQTSADNPEWLDLFKKAHGLKLIPTQVGGQGAIVPDDLETYGDLGLRVPFCVQLSAYNAAQAANDIPAAKQTWTKAKVEHLRGVAQRLRKDGLLCSTAEHCWHTDCEANRVDLGLLDDGHQPFRPSVLSWCSQAVTPQNQPEMKELISALSARANEKCGAPHCEKMEVQAQDHFPDGTLQDLLSSPLSWLETPENRTSFSQFHRSDKPRNAATTFTTEMNAWPQGATASPTADNGDMLVDTSQIDMSTMTTSAMIEYIDGYIGHNLPFNNHVSTAETRWVPVASGELVDWSLPASPEQGAAITHDIEEIITETTEKFAHEAKTTSSNCMSALATQSLADGPLPFIRDENKSSNALPVNETFSDVMDMDFDSIFDIPAD